MAKRCLCCLYSSDVSPSGPGLVDKFSLSMAFSISVTENGRDNLSLSSSVIALRKTSGHEIYLVVPLRHSGRGLRNTVMSSSIRPELVDISPLLHLSSLINVRG